MLNFNYGKYFDEHKVFNIENLSERDKMSQAIEDAKKIEKYFFNIVPNIDKIKNIIAFSFKLNPYLNYLDRINYIRGIIYSQDYIDYNDISEFYNLISDYTYVVDIPTIFKEKAFREDKNLDFFDDLMVIDKLYGNNIFSDFINNDASSYDEENDQEEDEDENENDEQNSNTVSTIVKEVAEIINSVGQSNTNHIITYEFDNYDNVDVTPKQKINMFKKNFNRYVDIILKCKEIDENKNQRAYICVILGMTDWFDFVIDKLETIYNIAEAEKKCLRNKLSDFI